MAKRTTPRKKSSPKKTAAKRKRKSSKSADLLTPSQRAKALRKIRKIGIKPSHPSRITGPAIELDYAAPVSKPARKKSKRKKR